jgi:hypothetical protein
MWGGLVCGMSVAVIIGIICTGIDPEGVIFMPVSCGIMIAADFISAIIFMAALWFYRKYANRQVRDQGVRWAFMLGCGIGLGYLGFAAIRDESETGGYLAIAVFLAPAMLAILVTQRKYL